MTWVFVIGLGIVVLGFMVFVLKIPRGAWEAVASALVLGLAGYVIQGSPRLAGMPKENVEKSSGESMAMVDARSKVSDQTIPTLNRWVIIADGLARNGQYGDAAGVLRGAVSEDPVNSEAWLAMGNTLVAHADNTLTPASLYAYRRAVKADPKAPGPPFFLGLALAQQGRLIEARELWAGLVKRAPEDAPWREPIAVQVMRLDEAIAVQKGK